MVRLLAVAVLFINIFAGPGQSFFVNNFLGNFLTFTQDAYAETGTITINVKNQGGTVIGAATFDGTTSGAMFVIQPNPLPSFFAPPFAVDIATVVDNLPPDANPASGVIQLIGVPFGTYSITEIQPPPGFLLPSNPTQANLVLSATTPSLVVDFLHLPSVPAPTLVLPVVATVTSGVPLVVTATTPPTPITVPFPGFTLRPVAQIADVPIILNLPLAFGGTGVSLTVEVRVASPAVLPGPPVSQEQVFLDITATGIDFFSAASFSAPPTITFLVTTQAIADRILGDPFNCPVIGVFRFNPTPPPGVWEPVTSVARVPSIDVGKATATTLDDKCGYIATTDHLSKFSVGGIARPTSTSRLGSGGYDSGAIVDTTPPSITAYNWKPDAAAAGTNETIYAQITDDVSIDKALVFYYGPGEDSRSAHGVSMSPVNGEWYSADIPGSSVQMPNISFWIQAMDASGNSAKTHTTVINVQKGVPPPQVGPSVTNLPASVLQQIKPKQETPTQQIEVLSMIGGNEINSFTDKIVIKNTGNITADNIRIMPSPEIYKNFRLSTYTIQSIAPQSNVTITLQHVGGQNKDVFGGLLGYNGQVLVMGEHMSPISLPVNIDPGGLYLQGHMFITQKIAGMQGPDARYVKILSNGNVFSNSKISLLNSLLSKKHKIQYDYEVTTSNGDAVITSPNGTLTIKNLSEKELKNVRIYLSNIGKAFLPDQNVITYLKPNGEISIKLIPRFNTETSFKDVKGELLIVPSNDIPIAIPVEIAAEKPKNSADEYEAVSSSNISDDNHNGLITTAADKITIKNIGERTIDSMKLMLGGKLSSIISLDKDSFKKIKPDEQVTVQLKYNTGDLRTFMQDYQGDLIIVSEHHNMKSIPISIEWKKVESKHFTIYARNGDEQTAKELMNLLESNNNYQKVTSRFGDTSKKTVIYMAHNMDEMKLVSPSGHPYYSYTDDKIFACACDEPKFNTMKEFVYRLIINNYPSYFNMKKFELDKENWLLDGISSYVAAKFMDGMEKKYIDAFTSANDIPSTFQWYGYGTDAQYGATYTFLEYLEDKYGSSVIDKTLQYLGSGMVSNGLCSTLEECSVLRAVYNVNGWNMHEEKYDLGFNDIAKGWGNYVIENYGSDNVSVIEKFASYVGQYDLSGLNTFQKVEALKALADQHYGLTLTPTERAVLDLAKVSRN